MSQTQDTEKAPPTCTGGNWGVDRFIRRLASDLYRRGLLTELSTKAESRVTAAVAYAFEADNPGRLPELIDAARERQRVERVIDFAEIERLHATVAEQEKQIENLIEEKRQLVVAAKAIGAAGRAGQLRW